MKVEEIYNRALYLAEKTDDNSGQLDDYYKKQHLNKALKIIEQAIYKVASIENIIVSIPPIISLDVEISMPTHYLKNIIPNYVGAVLAQNDLEFDKYNFLITEYEQALASIKHSEEQIEDRNNILKGLI